MFTPTAISDADRRAADSAAELHTIMRSEIWGANSNVGHLVGLPGLQGWVYSAPIDLMVYTDGPTIAAWLSGFFENAFVNG